MFEHMMANDDVVGGFDAIACLDDLDAMPARNAGRAWIDVETIAGATNSNARFNSLPTPYSKTTSDGLIYG